MPQTKSAKKALRQEFRRKKVNSFHWQKVKKTVKAARQKANTKTLTDASSALDRATKKGLIHANKAARLKSNLAKLVRKSNP